MVPVLVEELLCKRTGCIAIDLITSGWVSEIQPDWIICTAFIAQILHSIELILLGGCWDRLSDSRIHKSEWAMLILLSS